MIPNKFTITGSRGIKAGMNRDSISVDLDKMISPDAKQVAIVGDNGSGKSTLLALGMDPHREPQGIRGSIYDQFDGNGKRDIQWFHGCAYRSVMEYKTGKTKTQKAVLLFEDLDGAWRPVRLPDNTVSDGKTRTYDACLSHIIGPRELYYICANRTQGAPKIADHDDAKGLLRSLLDLDHVDVLQDRAKGIRREATRKRDALRETARDAGGLREQIHAHEAEIGGISAALPGMDAAISSAGHNVALAKAEYEAVVKDDYARIDLVRRRQDAQQRIDEIKDEWRQKWLASKRELESAQRAEAQAISDSNKEIETIEKDIAQANHEIAAHKSTLAQRDTIIKAAVDLQSLQDEIEAQEVTLDHMDTALAELRRIDQEIAQYDSDIMRQQAMLDALEADIEDRKKRASFVRQVPCRGQGEYAACPALRDAVESQQVIANKQLAMKERHASIDRVRLCRGDKLAERNSRGNITPEERKALSGIITGMRAQIAALQRTAALQHKLEAAEAAVVSASARLSDLATRLQQAKHDMNERVVRTGEAVVDLRAELSSIEVKGKDCVAVAQKALEDLPEPGSTDAIDKAKAALTMAEQASLAAVDAASAARARRTVLVARIESLTEDIDKADRLASAISNLDNEIAYWDLLAKGLQGVVDLSIEAAGPSIASIANDMLHRTFGSRFSLRIVTQREQANGVTAETFDIYVYDSETDDECSIIHKSGGESVWLDAALSLAVSVYQQDAAGRRYETRFADEADDGLAADRKRMYYKMSRAAMDLGGYEREYFVSHHPDAAIWADAVIDVGALGS